MVFSAKQIIQMNLTEAAVLFDVNVERFNLFKLGEETSVYGIVFHSLTLMYFLDS